MVGAYGAWREDCRIATTRISISMSSIAYDFNNVMNTHQMRTREMREDVRFSHEVEEASMNKPLQGLPNSQQSIERLAVASTEPVLHGNFYASGQSNVQFGHVYNNNNFSNHPEQRNDGSVNLLNSLNFPSMGNRVYQITDASPKTYRWLLAHDDHKGNDTDSFRTWLQNLQDRRIFWIAGKPGSGKSTIMKLISEDSNISRYLVSGAINREAVRLHHFFWSAGNQLQKSVEGFLRHLLVQILRRYPDFNALLGKSLRHLATSGHDTTWPVGELQASILALVQGPLSKSILFVAVDGLDECEGSTANQELLMRTISELAAQPNVKVCTSSRPYNKFIDRFLSSPQILLEQLTSCDITEFVRSRFSDCGRWRMLERMNTRGSQALVNQVISRTEGVFLWVSLVMRDLIQILEDGGHLSDLERHLCNVPQDLERYFSSMLESINPVMRSEASVLLQVAVYEEEHFATLLKFSLMDVICMDIVGSSTSNLDADERDFLEVLHEDKMRWYIDSALRKVSSRCKGLLQCVVPRLEASEFGLVHCPTEVNQAAYNIWRQGRVENASFQHFQDYVQWVMTVTSMNVETLHRSFRDFLRLPTTRKLLVEYDNGQICDPRPILIDARTAQLRVIANLPSRANRVVGVASHIISALSVYGQAASTIPKASLLAKFIEPFLDRFADRYWYIQRSFEVWEEEQSNFMTLAIDFRLTSYVVAKLTPRLVARKQGRPILDYVLKPRFAGLLHEARFKEAIFKPHPDLDMLHAVLDCGADPNEVIDEDGHTLWADFLRTLSQEALLKRSNDDATKHIWSRVIKALLDANAALVLPEAWLLRPRHINAPQTRRHLKSNVLKISVYSDLKWDSRSSDSNYSVILYLQQFEDGLPRGFTQNLFSGYRNASS